VFAEGSGVLIRRRLKQVCSKFGVSAGRRQDGADTTSTAARAI
jgi:hypothetical protein